MFLLPSFSSVSAFTVTSKAQIEDYIVYRANHEGLSVKKVLDIARCESGLNPLAKSSSSSASGVFQFISGTWNRYSVARGLSPQDVWVAVNNINVAIDIMADEGYEQWECSKMV